MYISVTIKPPCGGTCTKGSLYSLLEIVQVHYKSYFTAQYFKSFFTFLLYINGLYFTMHVIKFSCHFVSIIISTYNQTIVVYTFQIHFNEKHNNITLNTFQ